MIETKFKHTEIGLIPHDWEVRNIKDCFDFKQGVQCAVNLQSLQQFDGCVRFIRIVDLTQPDESPRYIADPGLVHHVKKDDLFMVRYGSPGLVGYGYEGVIANNLFRLLPNIEICSKFYKYILTDLHDEILALSSSTTMPAVNFTALSTLQIPLPPTTAEQERIADALSKIDSLIVGLDELLEKKRAIKTGTMQQLLTGKKRLKGFTGKWVEKTIEELGDLTGAGVDKKSYQDETPVRLVNYLDVFRRDYIYNNELDFWVTAKETKKIQCNVLRGDVFFTPSSEMPYDIALSAVAMEDMPNVCYSYHIYRLRFREDIDELYRAYMFKSKAFYEQANQTCEGSGKRYVISLTKFKQMTVYYPSDKGEQHAIASILSAMDTEIASLEQKRDKYIAIKQGMMQQLLTGKIRLV